MGRHALDTLPSVVKYETVTFAVRKAQALAEKDEQFNLSLFAEIVVRATLVDGTGKHRGEPTN